jgi:hypothetical protein
LDAEDQNDRDKYDQQCNVEVSHTPSLYGNTPNHVYIQLYNFIWLRNPCHDQQLTALGATFTIMAAF